MKVITLIENKSENKDLDCEHGLSLYIEKDGNKIILDTGATGNFIDNAEKLGVSIKDVNIVVLSHGHYDHGGGLLRFLEINKKAKIYMKCSAKDDYFSGKLGIYKYIGIDKKVCNQYKERISFIDKYTEICKDVFIITDIVHDEPSPEGNKFLLKKHNNKYVKDDFEHEIILAAKDKEGIVVFTGCSHNGILNMLKTVKKTFLDEHIKAIIGGFHLMIIPNISCMQQKDIDYISNSIIEENIDMVYTGHCTGENGYERLKKILKDRVRYLSTGTEINF